MFREVPSMAVVRKPGGVAGSLRPGLVAVGLASLLAGCGWLFGSDSARYNPQAYEAELNRWIGRPENDLINRWGVPARSQLLSGGGQVLEYERRQDKEVTCTTLFTSNITGMIERWRYSGIDCRPLDLNRAQR
jgi:hypothetical protein